MNRSFWLGCAGLLLLLSLACSREPGSAFGIATAPTIASSVQHASSLARAAGPTRQGFASLPDRGELIAYPRQPVQHDGAYTWHRTDLSEAHALNAISAGNLRVTTPSGATLVVNYDRHIEHPSGDWTWVGHLAGQEGEQTILTFGPHAAFGSIAQPGQRPLRLTVRNGVSWLVETDPTKLAGIINAATRPTRPDYNIPPRNGVQTPPAASAPLMASAPAMSSATTATATTLDLVMGYTPAFASDNGGQSGAVTRLNYLVDVTNAAYRNSGINAQVRLVATVPVTYADNTSNDATLDQLTGYDSTKNTTTAPAAAFSGLRAAREQYGADLVSLVRSFRDPENGGCGVAWLIGGGQQGISTGDAYYGYSVVSDGTDAGTDGHTYYCLDETLAHELGHNMGANHDVDNAKGSDGVLDPGDYGAYPYSFGYKNATGGFYTIMAYGDTGQHIYRIFSDPRSTFCGGYACGNATSADNARTLTQTIPTVAAFRATVVSSITTTVANDFNGDGVSDILWRNASSGLNAIWRSANVSLRTNVTQVTDAHWKVVGTGDFNGDAITDVLWRNDASGSNAIWLSGNSGTPQSITAVSNLTWMVAGVGDFNGDGKADILWRNSASGVNAIWRSGDYATQSTVDSVTDVNWAVAAVADFDGDGKDDILWRNRSTGADTMWSGGSAAQRRAVSAVTDLNWKIVGAGDFNGDGASDLLWRNAAVGTNAIWQSANSAARQAIDSMSGASWTVVEVGDFNEDGKADVLWRNQSSGANIIWRTGNAATPQSVAAVTDLAWAVVP